MNFSLKKIQQYCENHTSRPSTGLKDLERETNLKTLAPQMISGAFQGQLLSMLVAIHQPQKILEIGTFTGYAAVCFAKSLPPDGHLHTIEVNRELRYIIEKYFKAENVDDKVTLYIGDAKAIIPTIEEKFDLIFIDAGKRDYIFYYDLVFEKLNKGGLIIADNTLWNGKVVMQEHDTDTSIIHAFNQKVQNDSRVENILLPIRDGLMIARKIED